MDTSSKINQPRTLKPAIISASTKLITPGDYWGGIPVRAVEGDMQVVVGPWQEMAIGDRFDMYINDKPVWGKDIEQADVGQPLVFKISEGYILEGDAAVKYSVNAPFQVPEFSATQIYLVKLKRPGGLDADTGEGHSGLRYTFIPDLKDGVDLEMAELGIDMLIHAYENMAAFDLIICRWGSQEVTCYPVTQEQVDDPVKHPLRVTFSKEVIEKHGDGHNVAVTFQVMDRVGNYPERRAPWAKITEVQVNLGGNRLAPPQILVGGVVVEGVIHLDDLGKRDVTIRVYAVGNDFAKGDKLRIRWTGTPAQGEPIIVRPADIFVDAVPYPYDAVIDNASVMALAKGWASVGFDLIRDEAIVGTSKNASVSVQGEISDLAAPTIDEAPGGTLEPDAPWATHRIAWYAGRKSSDQINLIWEAPRVGGGTEYYADPRPVGNVGEGAPVLRSVPAEVIRRFNGLRVKVHYTVANDDLMLQNVRDSLALTLQVGVALPQFVRPQVQEALDGVLEPDRVPPAGATLVVPHTDTRDKDRVTYTWRGSAAGGSTSDYVDLTTHTAGQPVKFTVAKQFVTANLNGTAVATYSIIRNEELLGTSHELPLRIGKAQAELPPPRVIEAPQWLLDPNVHQRGFKVEFDTSKLAATDQVELEIVGRPGDGSMPAQLKDVAGQATVTFDVHFSITGANLQRIVFLKYRVISAGQGTPVQSVELKIGELLQSSMPMSKLEGFHGEVLDVGLIKDDTKVLCEAWPFQRRGLKVWLFYVESRTDGSEGTNDQLVGAVHDQSVGLSYTADIEWLRKCRTTSKLTVVLKVGFTINATLGDAFELKTRSYTIEGGFEDLSTFTNFEWNGWEKFSQAYPSEILFSNNEYYVESTIGGQHKPIIILRKVFNLEVEQQYAFSFDYRSRGVTHLTIIVAGVSIIEKAPMLVSTTWRSLTYNFLAKQPTNEVVFQLGNSIHTVSADNLLLKKVTIDQ